MSRRSFVAGLLLIGAGAGVTACTRSDAPADPVWGKEPCAHCKMLVGDKRFAAQVVADGEHRWFDDIGCMVLWLEEHPSSSATTWVYDAASARWLDARAATYASGAATPMDFGWRVDPGGATGFAAVRESVLARRSIR